MITDPHIPVMLNEVIAELKIKTDGIYVDATFGRGGHTKAILAKLGAYGRVIVIDKDPYAIEIAKKLSEQDHRVSVYYGSYEDILDFCQTENIIGNVNGVILDLGVSSPQLEQANRGFSFSKDGPLDMRMDPNKGRSAGEWLQQADEQEIYKVLKVYGEEKYARRIARAICHAKQEQSITTTKSLSDLITNVYPRKYELNKHPATRSFQAIRIFINNELEELVKVLEPSVNILAPAGRLVVISFHSLEDRIVKRFINEQAKGDNFPYKLPITAKQLQPLLKKIGKLQRPSHKEILENSRARSAVLRVAEKLG
jgi:16S rRNA (cytosine1402-N4)-methyltransferase